MHPNPAFRTETRQRKLEFARDRAFGTLAVSDDGVPLLSHIPFLLSDDGAFADLHLVRSNPIARTSDGPALLAVSGPDAYVSPDWYGVADQVPTWNYVAVHLVGHLEKLPEQAMADMLDRQSAAYESRLAPKAPWTVDKLTAPTRQRLMRMILPYRLHIEHVEGTWKLSQNKSDDARRKAADGLDSSGIGHETAALASLMRDLG